MNDNLLDNFFKWTALIAVIKQVSVVRKIAAQENGWLGKNNNSD